MIKEQGRRGKKKVYNPELPLAALTNPVIYTPYCTTVGGWNLAGNVYACVIHYAKCHHVSFGIKEVQNDLTVADNQQESQHVCQRNQRF